MEEDNLMNPHVSSHYLVKFNLELIKYIIRGLIIALIATVLNCTNDFSFKNPEPRTMVIIDISIICVIYLLLEFEFNNWSWPLVSTVIALVQGSILASSNYNNQWINMLEMLSDYERGINPKMGVFFFSRLILLSIVFWNSTYLKIPSFHVRQLSRILKLGLSCIVMVVHFNLIRYIEQQCDQVNSSEIHVGNIAVRNCIDKLVMSNIKLMKINEIIEKCMDASPMKLGSISECFSNVEHINKQMGIYTVFLIVVMLFLSVDLTKSSWSKRIYNYSMRNISISIAIMLTLSLITINPTNNFTVGGTVHQIVAIIIFLIFPIGITIFVCISTRLDTRSKNIITMFCMSECICCLYNSIMFGLGFGYNFEVGIMKHSMNLFLLSYNRMI
jgi:hypothetical protein